MKNSYKANDKMILRLFLKLLPMQMLLYSIPAICNLISSIYAGQFIGSQAVAAIGLYFPISMVVNGINVLIYSGSQVVCGKIIGQMRFDRVKGLFSLSIALCLFIGVSAGLILFFGAPGIAAVLGARDECYRLLVQYIKGCAFLVPMNILLQTLATYLALDRKENASTFCFMFYILLCLSMNYLFVVVLKLELFGQAFANAVSTFIICIIFSLLIRFNKDSIFRINVNNIDWNDIGEIAKRGYPVALAPAFQMIRGIVVNSYCLWLGGSDSVATLSVCNTLINLFCALPVGACCVFRMLASVCEGEEDRDTLLNLLNIVTVKIGAATLVVSALASFFAPVLVSFILDDPESAAFKLAVRAFSIFAWSLFGIAIGHLGLYYYQIKGKHISGQVLAFFDGCMGSCASVILLTPFIGIDGIWFAQVGNGVIGILVMLVIAIIIKRRLPKNQADFYCVPDDFGISEDARVSFSVRTREDVTEVSSRIMEFCKKRNISGRRSNIAALSAEEMARNIVEHGFHLDRKKHYVDIRVSDKGEHLYICIKDDCRPFNPKQQLAQLNPDDPCKNIGLRMISRLADSLEYNSVMGLNVLTIEI